MTDRLATLNVGLMHDELQELIRSYGLDNVTLLLVPSVHDWLVAHEIESNNPFRLAAFVHLGDGTRWIVVRDEVTSDDPGATTLFFHVEREDYDWISGNLALFAHHLVLHEIAHVRGMMDEAEVDRWTVPELRKIEARGSRDPSAGPAPLT